MTTTSASKLSSLAQWSKEHIRDVFESFTDEDAIRAVEQTFSKNLKATLNGKKFGQAEVEYLVLAMRKESGEAGLKVEWQQSVEVPQDSNNRDGSFGGVYVIHGIYRTLPGHDKPTEFARHKTVTVRIESQNTDPTIDSRRIVDLVFVASDIQVDQRAQL